MMSRGKQMWWRLLIVRRRLKEWRKSTSGWAWSRSYGSNSRINLFRKFCDQTYIIPVQHLTIAKAIIELTDSSWGFDLSKRLPCEEHFVDDTIVVYEEDKQILPRYHNVPLFITAFIPRRRAQVGIGGLWVFFEHNINCTTQRVRVPWDQVLSSQSRYPAS